MAAWSMVAKRRFFAKLVGNKDRSGKNSGVFRQSIWSARQRWLKDQRGAPDHQAEAVWGCWVKPQVR